MKNTLRAVITAIVFLVPVLVTSAQESGGVLSVGVVSPVQLDPHLGTNDPEILLNRQIYDYLYDVSPEGDLIPQLATDVEISDDGLVYTFALAEGVTFSDGTPFTSADVVFSFTRIQDLESPAINLLGDFEVTADGDNTVVFTLTEPNADFLYGVGSRWSFILKDGTTDVNVVTEDMSNFIGTGPFVLENYSDGEGATLVANTTYWIEGQPALDGLELVFIDEQQAKIDAVRAGAVDMTIRLSADRIAELREVEGLTVITRATNLHPVIRLRTDDDGLGADPRVRQAFKLATDRELLALDLFGEPDIAVVGNNDPIGPSYGQFYQPIADEYDPEAACALLEEAGFPDGLGADDPIEFFVVDAFNYPDMATFLQEQWLDGCINVEILVRPENVYYGDNEWLEVDLGVTGWGSRPIPQQYFTEAYITGASFNESRFSDLEVDELVAQAAVTTDVEARAEIYGQIAQIFAERGPIIIPFFAPTVGVINNSVQGLDLHSFPGRTDFRTVTVSE